MEKEGKLLYYSYNIVNSARSIEEKAEEGMKADGLL